MGPSAGGGGISEMARLFGDKVLPEAVQSRRRSLRMKLEDMREPVRQRREQYVPGPDIIGNLESSFSSARQNFVSRDTLLTRIRARRDTSEDEEAEEQNSSETTSTSSRNALT